MQKKDRKLTLPYLTKLIMKLAPLVGAKVVVEPEWRYAAQIIFKNGVVRSLRHYALDLNHDASYRIACDKDFAKFFMAQRGYPIAEGKTIFEADWAKALKSNRTIAYAEKYAKKLGYPVIVKPNSKNQGTGVCLAWNKIELKEALLKAFKEDKVAIIERYLPGLDYRIVVLDGEIISSYHRIPLSITGDGKHSILELLKMKQKLFYSHGRNTHIDLKDPRIKTKLRKQGYSFQSVPYKNQKIYLLDNANLSTGGDSVDTTDTIHAGFKKIAAKLTRDMGLRLCGVDIMVTKGDIAKNPKECSYYIIEINAVPGLDHYVAMGRKQRKIVEAMYLKVLKALGKKD
jgi:D-alanine-D-alanine ligase-like ATP-grasp enzyme